MSKTRGPSPLPDIWSQRLNALGHVRLGPDAVQVGYMVVGGLALLAGGVAIAVGSRTAGPIVLGSVLALLGATLLGYTADDLLRGKLTITVTDDGIEVGPRRFPWRDVLAVGTSRGSRSSLVALELTAEAMARLPRLSRHGTHFYLPSVTRVSGPVLAGWLESVRVARSDHPPTPTG